MLKKVKYKEQNNKRDKENKNGQQTQYSIPKNKVSEKTDMGKIMNKHYSIDQKKNPGKNKA